MTKRISIIAAGLVVVVIIILVVLLTTQDIFNLTGTEEENDLQMISTALIQRKDLRTFEKIKSPAILSEIEVKKILELLDVFASYTPL